MRQCKSAKATLIAVSIGARDHPAKVMITETEMHKNHRVIPLLAAGYLCLLTSCGDELPQAEERVRAIKPYYVSEPAGGDVRRYAGTVMASDTSSLSFSVAGTVQAVSVSQGDRVTRGQVLASLDPAPFEFDVDAAGSQLQSADAAYANARLERDRQAQLYEKQWVSKAAYDQSVAAFESAEGDLNLARSRLNLAERDLNNSRLVAPFDGVVASRDIEPFVEVSAGETLFQINSEGALELVISVPDFMISRFSIGLPARIDTTTLPTCGCNGRITEIGSAAGAGNAVPVKATLLDPPSQMLPGMTAEATVVLSNDENKRGYLVPLVAVAPGDKPESGYVFKFDPDTQTVNKTEVTGRAGQGNLVEITQGIGPGDILASAGVSLLRDGQKVTLMQQ